MYKLFIFNIITKLVHVKVKFIGKISTSDRNIQYMSQRKAIPKAMRPRTVSVLSNRSETRSSSLFM